jgi:hypothetical protein
VVQLQAGVAHAHAVPTAARIAAALRSSSSSSGLGPRQGDHLVACSIEGRDASSSTHRILLLHLLLQLLLLLDHGVLRLDLLPLLLPRCGYAVLRCADRCGWGQLCPATPC